MSNWRLRSDADQEAERWLAERRVTRAEEVQ